MTAKTTTKKPAAKKPYPKAQEFLVWSKGGWGDPGFVNATSMEAAVRKYCDSEGLGPGQTICAIATADAVKHEITVTVASPKP